MEQEEKRNLTETLQKEKQAALDKEKALQKEAVLSFGDSKNAPATKVEATEIEAEVRKETAEELDKKLEEILNI